MDIVGFFLNYCGNLSISFILRKRSSPLLVSLTLVQIRIAKLYGVTSYCRRESKNPFLQVIKTVIKKFDINFFYYFDLNYMCLTLYSLMSARYSECHGCSAKKKQLITCFIHIVTSYYCWPYQQVIWKSHNFHPLTCWTFSEENDFSNL